MGNITLTGLDQADQGAGWGWGLWRSPQEEPQPWGAGRAGSGVAWGALTVSPRLDGPSGGMFDITSTAPRCQVSQKGCSGCCLAQQRGLVPRWVSKERAGVPQEQLTGENSPRKAEMKWRQGRNTQHLSAQTRKFRDFGAWQFSPSCFKGFFTPMRGLCPSRRAFPGLGAPQCLGTSACSRSDSSLKHTSLHHHGQE